MSNPVVTRYVDYIEGNIADVSGPQTLRTGCFGGTIQQSFDGGPFTGAASTSGLNFGAMLADASATVNPAADSASAYLMPPKTQTANRSITIGTTGSPPAGLTVTIFRYDLSANTLALVNGGPGAGTQFTFPASPTKPQACALTFDGTNWGSPVFYYLAN